MSLEQATFLDAFQIEFYKNHTISYSSTAVTQNSANLKLIMNHINIFSSISWKCFQGVSVLVICRNIDDCVIFFLFDVTNYSALGHMSNYFSLVEEKVSVGFSMW